jgi:hypothetical protein
MPSYRYGQYRLPFELLLHKQLRLRVESKFTTDIVYLGMILL